jgi:hypothetical protein
MRGLSKRTGRSLRLPLAFLFESLFDFQVDEPSFREQKAENRKQAQNRSNKQHTGRLLQAGY